MTLTDRDVRKIEEVGRLYVPDEILKYYKTIGDLEDFFNEKSGPEEEESNDEQST